MKAFIAFFTYELKRFFNRKYTVVFLLFLVLGLYFIRDGVSQYKYIIENKAQFQEIEKVKVTTYINYTQYGNYGFRLLFIPSPLSIFFINSSLITELTANIDTTDILRIYNSFKGKNLYADKAGGYKDFSGIILLFGTLLVLYFGYDSFRNKDYIKLLSSFSSYRKVFSFIQISRVLLLMCFFVILTLLGLLLLALNGIVLSGAEFSNLLRYLLVLFLVVLFLFLLGAMAGTIRSRFMGIVVVMVIWFGLVFFIPGTVYQLVSKRADDITSNYRLEFEKLKIVMDFEDKALDEAKRYTNMEEREKSERKLVEGFWNNEFRKIQAFEEKMQTEMMDNFRFFRDLSILFPTTFYLSTNNEISSRGYESFFRFYRYVCQLKERFVRYYINKKFYSNYKEVESFIKGDENLFYSASQLPRNFGWGVVLNLFYVLLLIAFSYLRFKSFLFCVPDKSMPELKKLNVELKSGYSEVVLTGEVNLKNQFYNIFAGVIKEYKGKLMVDDTDIAAKQGGVSGEFLYLCHPEEIPEEIKAGNLASLFQNLMKLSKKEKAELYLKSDMDTIERKHFSELDEAQRGDLLWLAAQLKRCKILMLDDFARGMPADFIIRLINSLRKLKEDGCAIVYLTNDTMIVKKIGDSVTSLYDDPNLHKHLKTYRFLKDDNVEMPLSDQDKIG
jgi:ABC-type Na+ transport system ATPase subunit NatA